MNGLTARHAWLDLACRAIVAAVLLVAGVPKLMDPVSFAEAIDNYRILPRTLVAPLALLVPPVEIVTALALLTGIAKRGAALISLILLGVFAVAIAQAVIRGIDIDCGCFGAAENAQASWWGVTRNAGLMVCCAIVLRVPAGGDPDHSVKPRD